MSTSSSLHISLTSIKNPNHHLLLHRPITVPIRTRRLMKSNSTTTNEASTSSNCMTLYDLLGISETGSSIVEIKKAYKQLARKYHPDVSPPGLSEEYTQRFIRVQEAYETLSDPKRRALYDHLVFSTANKKTSFCYNRSNIQGMEDDKEQWKNRWQAQVSGLKKRSMDKEDTIRRRSNANNNDMSMSWGARMRQQMTDSSEED